ncbi:MAG: acyltransferase [Planctomycetaceae bacterium]
MWNWIRNQVWPEQRPFEQGLEKHSPPLDGVRGLAVLLVLMYDCLKIPNDGFPPTLIIRKVASAGWIGVDLFFVLSGFLITGILLETRGRVGYWKSFLTRRAVRIFPLYYATLIGVFVIVPTWLWLSGQWTATHPVAQTRADQWYYWFYLQNVLFAWRGSWPAERILNHFWSLAVEEQFYLVWPLVVAALSRKNLTRLCGVLCAVALGLRLAMLTQGLPGVTTYALTFTRMDSLCFGALIAIGLRNASFYRNTTKWFPGLLLISGLLLVGVDVVWPVLKSQDFAAYTLGHTLIALFFVSLIGTLATVPADHVLYRGFSLPPLQTLGKYSYAIYVFHRFAYSIVHGLSPISASESIQGWVNFGGTVLLSLLFAKVSWTLIEQPFLRLKKYAPRPDECIPQMQAAVMDPPAVARPVSDEVKEHSARRPHDFNPVP